MNIRNTLLGILGMLLFLVSCTNDESGAGSGEGNEQAANRWIYDNLLKYYLWNDEITSSPNYKLGYQKFFDTLLSEKDGKHIPGIVNYNYSYITRYVPEVEKTRAVDDHYTNTYGFDYILTQSYLFDPVVSEKEVHLKYYATVSYVVPGSPADSLKLKRGDHIYKIGGKEIPHEGYTSLLSQLRAPSVPTTNTTTTTTFTVCELTEISRVTVNGHDVPVVTRNDKEAVTKVVPAKVIDKNPIGLNKIIPHESKQIGYLLYNEFERGGEQGVYDNQLKNDVFSYFREQGITELVLDLRYNPGGYLTSCLTLASLLVKPDKADEVFQKSVYNDNTVFEWKYQKESNSAALDRIYILATGYSASASEALLHCIKAADVTVYHIGSTTEGKNVGMNRITTDSLKDASEQKKNLHGWTYEMWPVSFYIYDANDKTYSTDGIEADYVHYEEFEVDFPDLGDPADPLLAAALYHIDNGSFPGTGALSRASSPSSLSLTIDRPAEPKRSVKPAVPYKLIK